MVIPEILLRSVGEGKVVLLLGSGASKGSADPSGKEPPTGIELAALLSDRFLGGLQRSDPLSVVAELAISEADLFTVQDYIRTIFQDIQPAPFHKILPTFKWAGLATTNYDLVIERAYSSVTKRVQDVVPLTKNGDRVEELLRSTNGLMLLKLHGCITRVADPEAPLILTVDQYVTHRKGRERIFEHLHILGYEHPIVFVGHSLQDPDIRQLLLELGPTEQRPRFFTVTPHLSDPETRLWENKRVSPLKGSFEEFLHELDSRISSPFRGIVVPPSEPDIPIASRFVVREPGLSQPCREFLTEDVEYVRREIPFDTIDPKMFYRGFSDGWAPIAQDLDVRRSLADTILADRILTSEPGDCLPGRLYVVKGPAGSGKSVLLRRVAWDAAISFDRLCLYLRPHGRLSFESLRELSQLTNEHIYLFVERLGEHVSDVLDVVKKSQKFKLSLTVIGEERTNEWNMSCEALASFVSDEFDVKYLNTREIDDLLSKLELHHSLCRLETASADERRAAFAERAGRQLLVALHEATLGKPFEDIIADEYSEIRPELAQLMYQGVCFLNRFDVPVRAGIIARLYGIRFTAFKERFFRPLQEVVIANYDQRTRDYIYSARHPHIAEIVFERILSSVQDRLDLYIRMIGALNIDYDADRTAFRRLVRGRSLIEVFPDHQMIEAVYQSARNAAGEDAYLFHQMAIYEMNRRNGSLDRAAEYLGKARGLAQHDRTIMHSYAELALRQGEAATTPAKIESYLRDAKKLALALTRSQATDAHGHHTLAKIALAGLRRILDEEGIVAGEYELANAIKEAEEAIEDGLQSVPGDPYLLETESQLGELLADQERAIQALQSAHATNPQNAFITIRLAKLLARADDVHGALGVYDRALAAGSVDKRVHFNYAKLLLEQEGADGPTIEYHLRRAFTEGDKNIEAQFWYARQLYINGPIPDAQRQFLKLREMPIDPAIKRQARGAIREGSRNREFTGRIIKLETSYAIIARDGTGDRVFLHISNVSDDTWSQLTANTRLRFSMGFTFSGPSALDVSIE